MTGAHIKIIESIDSFLSESDKMSPSAAIDAASLINKALIISCASYLEYQICAIIEDYYKVKTNNCEQSVLFVKNKAISRQYHTYFNWDAANISTFAGMFGPRFKQRINQLSDASEDFNIEAVAFIRIGKTRNMLAHNNFYFYTESYTTRELRVDFLNAIKLIERIRSELHSREAAPSR